MKVTDIKHLVLSGGGMLGISYLGLLKYLEENSTVPIINNLESITGCSAGSIFGTLIALGYTSTELNSIVKIINFKDFITINAESIINFMKLKGLDSGKNLITFVKKCIKDKTDNENFTFLEMKQKFNIELQIGVTNLSKSRFELMNSVNTPNIPIFKAINASFAIPFIFEPIIIDDDVYCDGGIINNLPIENIFAYKTNTDINDHNINEEKANIKENKEENTEENKLEKKEENTKDTYKNSKKKIVESVLGIYLLNEIDTITKNNYQTINFTNYMSSFLHTMSFEFINKKIQINNIDNEKYKIIMFKIPYDIMTFLKIKSSHKDIDNIIEIAYDTTKLAFSKVVPKSAF